MSGYSVNQPSWSELLKRAGDLKGDDLQLLDDKLSPSLTVDDFSTMEYRWLRRTASFCGRAQIAAVAAQFSHFSLTPRSLQTPGASPGIIAVVESITMLSAAGTQFYDVALISFTEGGARAAAPGRDARMLAGGATALSSNFLVGGQAQVARAIPITGGLRFAVQAGDTQIMQLGWVLTDQDFGGGVGCGLVVENVTVNNEAQGSITWYERAALTSER
jgi:hypothetical protein